MPKKPKKFDLSKLSDEELARETARRQQVRLETQDWDRKYEITVTFTRYVGEDLEHARERWPNDPMRHALLKQFVMELQGAYDDGCIEGFYDIHTIDGVKVESFKAKDNEDGNIEDVVDVVLTEAQEPQQEEPNTGTPL